MSAPILLTRSADAPRQDLDAYVAAAGYEAYHQARQGDPADVLQAVEAAGLLGRGGAAFPVAVKWKLAASHGGGRKHVVANGGEHEPGSDKDKFLVEKYPHAVLEGMALCALATGATRGWLYLIEDMVGPLASAEQALRELREAGMFGDAFEVSIHRAPTTYVAGEESAAIDSIEGGPGKPRKKPPYPGESGIHGEPTTVNNVETLAHVPWILRHGAAAYRHLGTPDSPGTMLFTLDARFRRPGVHEVAFGTTWRELFDAHGGGLAAGGTVRAIQPALSCAFLGAEHLDLPIAHETLRPLGSSPGCGGVSVILDGEDPLPRLREIAGFFMREQCGQCPPCRMETNQFAHVLGAVAAGKGPGYAEQIRKIAGFARGKGYCSLIEMAAAPIVSALDVFAVDLERSAAGGGNPA